MHEISMKELTVSSLRDDEGCVSCIYTPFLFSFKPPLNLNHLKIPSPLNIQIFACLLFKTMQLIIVTYAGHFFIDVHPQEPILEIKQKISNTLSISITSQTLDVLGLELIDGLDLGDYPMIVEGTKIDLFVDSSFYDMAPMELEHDHDNKILVTIKFSSRQINIEVEVTETVQSLKEKIHILDGTPTKRMSLYISGLEMDEECRYLGEYGVQEFSEISVSLKSMNRVKVEPSTRKLSMVIQTSISLLSASIPLEMKDSCSVNEVRQLLLSRKILPVDDYIFIHKQRIMRDSCTLRWHGVENGDYLYVFTGTVSKDGR
ncbi:polyubiquitin [Silene latifolia]|uniref:polyubiquitin n=1 Tax=Silene latifolia TaxID=37657 RepID=UPI003D781372